MYSYSKYQVVGNKAKRDDLSQHFLHTDTHTCVCLSGGKCSIFFELCFLVTQVLRFALLPSY